MLCYNIYFDLNFKYTLNNSNMFFLILETILIAKT